MTQRTCQKPGCLGNDKKDGPYLTGECQTIELALKELQIHLDSYHENDAKKTMKCEVPDCVFDTELLPDELAFERLKLHVDMQHKKSESREEEKPTVENKAIYKAVKCTVKYKKGQTFDSFERELKTWKDATVGLPDHVKNMMFMEMLSNTENDEVKRFYITNVMNHEDVPKTIDSIMKKLTEKFSKSERQKWDEVFERISHFEWKDKTPKEAWDSLEVDKFNASEVWKSPDNERPSDDSTHLLNKMLIRTYLRKGKEEKKFDKALLHKIEEEVVNAKYNWDKTRKVLK